MDSRNPLGNKLVLPFPQDSSNLLGNPVEQLHVLDSTGPLSMVAECLLFLVDNTFQLSIQLDYGIVADNNVQEGIVCMKWTKGH